MALGVTGQTETGGGAQRARAAVCVTAVTSHALSLRARVCSEGSGGVASWPEGKRVRPRFASPAAPAPGLVPDGLGASFPAAAHGALRLLSNVRARPRAEAAGPRCVLGWALSVGTPMTRPSWLWPRTLQRAFRPHPSGPPRAPASRRASHRSALSVLEAPPHLLIGDFINLIPT